jgi:hypothetical protein
MTLIGPLPDSSLYPFYPEPVYPGDGMLAVCILFYHHHYSSYTYIASFLRRLEGQYGLEEIRNFSYNHLFRSSPVSPPTD